MELHHRILVLVFMIVQISTSGCFQENQLSCSYTDGPDEDSIVQLQSCSETSLEIQYGLNEYTEDPTLIIELHCTDNTQRFLSRSGISVTDSLVFVLDPPLSVSGPGSECTVSICYQEGYFYQTYTVLKSPQTLSFQHDCQPPPAPDIPTVPLQSSHIDYIDEELASTDVGLLYTMSTSTPSTSPSVLLYNKILTVLPQVSAAPTQTTPHDHIIPNTSTLFPGSPSSSSIPAIIGSTSTQQRTTHHTTSFTSTSSPVPVPERTSSSYANSHSPSLFVTKSPFKHSVVSSSAGSGPLSTNSMLPVESISNFILSPTLIFTVSLLVFVTLVVVIIATVLCMVQLITQYHKRVRLDIQDIPPVEIENKQIYTYSQQISHSPSICTIVSPLSPVNITHTEADSSNRTMTDYGIFSFDSSPTTRRYHHDESASSGIYSHNTSSIDDNAIVSRETSNSTINFTPASLRTTDELCMEGNPITSRCGHSKCRHSSVSHNYSCTSTSSCEHSGNISCDLATTKQLEDHHSDSDKSNTTCEDSYIRTILRNT